MNTLVETSAAFQQAAEAYQPDNANLADLRRRVMVPIVGPAAVGKTTLIESACAIEPEHFGYAKSFTTRPQREGESDDAYFFLPHDTATLETLAQRMRDKELVQIAVHPTTGYVYGSDVDSYGHDYNLLDTLYNGVRPLRRLPFGGCMTIGVSSQPPAWRQRFDDRYRGTVDRAARLREAIASLNWSLSDVETIWLGNEQDRIVDGAETLTRMARGDVDSEPDSRRYAQGMLKLTSKM